MAEEVVGGLVGPGQDGMRLDAFLATLPGLGSRSACARLVEGGRVSINGTPATSKSERVVLGDRVAAAHDVPDPVPEGAGSLAPRPDIPLDVRFEDEWLLVLAKQAGLVCHPSPGHEDDTLANALVAHCGYAHLGLLQGEERPGIVHRLDRDTSGLMVAAKDDDTQRALQDLIRLRALDRRYLTLVHGSLAHDEGTVTTGIARSRRDPLRMCVSDAPDAREAITDFRVLARFEAGPADDGYTLLECHLWTGRTHQIRVHMRHVGHPCVGDPLYGRPVRGGRGRERVELGLSRQFLHSWRLAFDHPRSGEHLSFEDALPDDLAAALGLLGGRERSLTPLGEELVPQALGPARP